jgi:hypothetical protein
MLSKAGENSDTALKVRAEICSEYQISRRISMCIRGLAGIINEKKMSLDCSFNPILGGHMPIRGVWASYHLGP